MKFPLLRFGAEEVEVSPDSMLTFPAGLLGFEDCTRFKLFHEEGKPSVFWLQSLDDEAVVLSVADPALLNVSYEVTLSDAEQELLGTAPGDELVLAVILFRPEESTGTSVSANTRAPIVINLNKRLGLQKLLQDFEAQLSIRGS